MTVTRGDLTKHDQEIERLTVAIQSLGLAFEDVARATFPDVPAEAWEGFR